MLYVVKTETNQLPRSSRETYVNRDYSRILSLGEEKFDGSLFLGGGGGGGGGRGGGGGGGGSWIP